MDMRESAEVAKFVSSGTLSSLAQIQKELDDVLEWKVYSQVRAYIWMCAPKPASRLQFFMLDIAPITHITRRV